jgi:hypothetical protein
MVPTLLMRISASTLADPRNLTVATPEGPMGLRRAGGLAAVSLYGFTPGPFPRHRSNCDLKPRRYVSAAPSGAEPQGSTAENADD